jgi:hypothetical protein
MQFVEEPLVIGIAVAQWCIGGAEALVQRREACTQMSSAVAVDGELRAIGRGTVVMQIPAVSVAGARQRAISDGLGIFSPDRRADPERRSADWWVAPAPKAHSTMACRGCWSRLGCLRGRAGLAQLLYWALFSKVNQIQMKNRTQIWSLNLDKI